jgi:hypothetical protein
MDDITVTKTVVHGQHMTSICIGEASGDLPRHLMTGEKSCGYSVQSSQITPWYWDSIRDRDGRRFIDFMCDEEVLPFSELTQSLRSEALSRLRELAQAFQLLPPRFIRPTNGYIETWRIYFFAAGGVLVLPEELSFIILSSAAEETKFTHITRFMKPDVEPPFGLCHQFTQFLYLAATGFSPYEDAYVREDRYRHIPLGLGFTALDSAFAHWIDTTLHLRAAEQRDKVSAAYSGEENLRWWLQETENFTWVEQSSVEIDTLERTEKSVKQFREQQKKRAYRKQFFRKRGALVASITLGVLILLSIFIPTIYKSIQPPYTAGMPANAVIEEFFKAQNELDLTKMDASLSRGTKNPYAAEISGLFVQSKIRQAYEGIESIVRADQWIAAGMPPIVETAHIYGNTQISIEQIDENLYAAEYFAYYPLFDEPVVEGKTQVVKIKKITEFTLTNTRGYWEITEINHKSEIPVETLQVETVAESQSLIDE